MNRIKILNVEIDNISQEELLAQLKKGVLVTPNVDDLIKHQHDKDFHRMASQAEFVVCDSKIMWNTIKGGYTWEQLFSCLLRLSQK